jgi:glycosyltransferase involved in cell wall biosynthesis
MNQSNKNLILNETKISIIVPIYNTFLYLEKCLESIRNQTHHNIEIILVNDGSTDKSLEICNSYCKIDHRFKLINKVNGGLAEARNSGIEIATGKFIGFVDSDDYIELNMYEKLLEGAIESNASISMCGRYNVSNEKTTVQFSFTSPKLWSSKEAIINLLQWRGIDSSVCDKLFKRELFSQIKFPVGFYNEDVAIICKLIQLSNKIYHIGNPKYYYVKRSNSITNQTFTIRKLDILVSNELLIMYVKSIFPDLNLLLSNYRYKGILYINELIQRDNINLYKFKLSRENNPRYLINKYILRIIFCSNLSFLEKVFAILLHTKLFSLLRNSYRFFKYCKI